MNLTNKIALVTGVGGDIGHNIALHLASMGLSVYGQYRRNLINKTELLEAPVRLLPADLQSEKDCNSLVGDLLRETNGQLYILVNCIGDYMMKSLKELSLNDLNHIIHSNLSIAFCLTSSAAKAMRKNGGRIINIGFSGASDIAAKPNILPYHIAKMGLLLMTKSFALEEAKHNILINCLSLGICQNNKYPSKINVPLGRPVKLFEISSAIYFLLSSDYITAADIQIDGAWRDAARQ